MMNIRRHILAAAMLIAGLSPAICQVPSFPQSVPANSVVGRLGIGPGPVQAIPFNTLKNYLGTMSGPGSSGVGNLAVFATSTGNVLADGGPITAFGHAMVGAANAAAGYGVLGIIPCAQTAALTGDITKAAGSCAVSSTYLSPRAGGVTRSLNSKLSDVNNAMDYGVVCDGVTDTRVQLQQAIDSTPIGGRLVISKQNTTGACIVGKNPAGAYALIFNEPKTFECDGTVAIQPNASVTSTTNVINVQGSPNALVFPFRWIGQCFIGNPGAATRNGLHGIYLDTTVAGNYMRGMEITGTIQAGSSLNGYGFYHLNNAINNPNGGLFASTIGSNQPYSVISGGIALVSSGDNIMIRGLVPVTYGTADNNGIYISLVAGAGQLILDNLNFSNPKGVIVDCALGSMINGGQYELQTPLTGTALINVVGNACTVSNFKIKNAQVQANGGIGTPLLINYGVNSTGNILDSNLIGTPTAYSPIVNNSSILICGNNIFTTGTPHVTGTAPSSTWGNGC